MEKEEKTIGEELKELAYSIIGKVESTESDKDSEEISGVAGAKDEALEPEAEGVEGAEDAQPSVSTEQVLKALEEVNSKLDEREEQVNKLVETVRLLIKAVPSVSQESTQAPKQSATAVPPSHEPFADLNLRR